MIYVLLYRHDLLLDSVRDGPLPQDALLSLVNTREPYESGAPYT